MEHWDGHPKYNKMVVNPGSTNWFQQTPTKYIQSHYDNTIGIDMQ